MVAKKLVNGYFLNVEEKKECEWLDSEGFSDARVKCEVCKKYFTALVHHTRRKRSLSNDTFVCQYCSPKLEKV